MSIAHPQCPSWGPWARDIDEPERMTRCRVLRALVHVLLRPKGHTIEIALGRAADGDGAALDEAARALDELPSVPLRHLLAAYAAAEATQRPRKAGKRTGYSPTIHAATAPQRA